MGIKYLNRYLINKCTKQSICSIPIQQLRGKTLAFDAFIYIYKYLGEDRLQERFQQLITACRKQTITPIFVFDGKPPDEKKCMIDQRRKNKDAAELQYNQLLHTPDASKEHLLELKKQFVRVTPRHVQLVKAVLQQNHVQYIEAPSEADIVCVQLVRSWKAWACVSDDMDMFVYGCTRVLRSWSLDDESVELYILPSILRELHMSMSDFRDILVISGTDYNNDDHIPLFKTIRLFRTYKNMRPQQKEGEKVKVIKAFPFYDWLRNNTPYIHDYDKLTRIHAQFNAIYGFESQNRGLTS